jgi:pimeloyl-ACP methyl ester carboxylesterase
LIRASVSGLDTTASGGVVEGAFHVRRNEHVVPAVLWRPAGPEPAPAPLVLLGHGGGGHNRSDRIVDLARRLVRTARLAVVAIDGPYPGDRVHEPLTTPEYQLRIAADGAANVVERMKGDWHATIDAVGELGLAATDTLGYVGLSMGSRYGLPLAAALGERLRCAVFGKFGVRQSPSLPAALDTGDLTSEAAAVVRARTLFHVHRDDEVFPRDGQLALFSLLASPHKRPALVSGRHAGTRPAAVSAWCDFVAAALTRGRPATVHAAKSSCRPR